MTGGRREIYTVRTTWNPSKEKDREEGPMRRRSRDVHNEGVN